MRFALHVDLALELDSLVLVGNLLDLGLQRLHLPSQLIPFVFGFHEPSVVLYELTFSHVQHVAVASLEFSKKIVVVQHSFHWIHLAVMSIEALVQRYNTTCLAPTVHDASVLMVNIIVEEKLFGLNGVRVRRWNDRHELSRLGFFIVPLPPRPVIFDGCSPLLNQQLPHPFLNVGDAFNCLSPELLHEFSPVPIIYLRLVLAFRPGIPRPFAWPVGESVQNQHRPSAVAVHGVRLVVPDSPIWRVWLRSVERTQTFKKMREKRMPHLAESVPFLDDLLVVMSERSEKDGEGAF
mmetsp:Transcript_8327/g.23161  ORF Transcript_8327/g.23161 Transcript_8327/m.23161 type:complete len:293 (-) Transcript_8327:684-1562(-)